MRHFYCEKVALFKFFGLHLDLDFRIKTFFGLWLDLDRVLKNEDWIWIAKFDSALISGLWIVIQPGFADQNRMQASFRKKLYWIRSGYPT